MDRLALVALDRLAVVDRLAEQVEDAAEGLFADGHHDRRAGIDGGHAPHEAVGRRESDGADDVVAEVLGDLADEVDAPLFVLDLDRVIDLGQGVL